jgi:hypothetical protein
VFFTPGAPTTNDLRTYREEQDRLFAAEKRDEQRERFEPRPVRFHQRITWVDGRPFVQRCPTEIVIERSPSRDHSRLGNYRDDGEIVRPATDADLDDMVNGRISYDPETHPGTLAWAAHVAAGGD